LERREAIPAELDRIGKTIVDAAFRVHSELGPGLLESIYETCLGHEIAKRGLKLRKQATLPIAYDGITFDSGLRLDLLVEGAVIVEVKAVERLLPVFEELHEARQVSPGLFDQFQRASHSRRHSAVRALILAW